MNRRVMVIVYYWPPLAGSGVQRWLKLTKYFSDHGVQAVVVTPKDPYYHLKDESLTKDVDQNVEILRLPIFEPYKIAELLTGKKVDNTGKVKKSSSENTSVIQKLMAWIRGRLFIPDPRIFWVRPTVKRLSKYLEKNPVDAIVTSGPPHSLHLVGRNLKRKGVNIPWLADFRDPMSQLDFLKSFGVKGNLLKKYQKIEETIVHEADYITGTSFSMHELLEDFDKSKYRTITNGYDAEDFEKVEVEKEDENFIVFHAGLLNEFRNPEGLWQALSNLSDSSEFANKIKIVLAGTIDEDLIAQIEKHPNLKESIEVLGYISHTDVIKWYMKSAVNLLLVNNSENAKVNIPGKLFELLAAQKPILAFGRDGCDAGKIVDSTNSGLTLSYKSSVKDIEKALLKMYMGPDHFRTSNYEKYERKQLAREYLRIIYDEKTL